MSEPCGICGEPESAHHAYTARRMPPGCHCDPNEWDEEILPICVTHQGDVGRNCQACEHDVACHDVEVREVRR